jgi:hypothetical protein
MKKYKFRLISTKKLIEQIKKDSERIKNTKKYIEFTTDSILDLFKKIKKINIELSKIEVESKSLKYDTYKIKDMQKEKEGERDKLNKLLEVGLSDLMVKIDLLLDDIKAIYLDCLTLLYRKYNELINLMKTTEHKELVEQIELLREQIKNIARGIFEKALAKEETVILKDIFEKRKTKIEEELKDKIFEIEELEKITEHPSIDNIKQISLELKDIQVIEMNVYILIPKIEEIIPEIDSETYLLKHDTEDKINKDILLIKKEMEQIKVLINEQARFLYEEIKVV